MAMNEHDDQAIAPDITVGLQAERLPVITYTDAYYWTCWACGWLGTGHWSLEGAQKEATAHWQNAHEQREVKIVRKDARR